MNKSTIARLRIEALKIVGSIFTDAASVVSWLGAVQAQDYSMAKWAIGLRCNGATADSVQDEIDSGSIIRTHVMRPTWHFVAADDIRWLLELTAPRIEASLAHRQRLLELDAKTLSRANKIIIKALEGGRHLTRSEIMTKLEKSKIIASNERATQIMAHAELQKLICNGVRRGKQYTYALLDERVPVAPQLTRNEALARLANRYFTSHGPATLKDFSWWSGLSAADAREGLENAKANLVSENVDSEVFWMSGSISPAKKSSHFLPAFDEFIVSYRDRSASLPPDAEKHLVVGHGIFNPIIVVDGRMAGIWKRSFVKNKVILERQFLPDAGKISENSLNRAALQYGRFEAKETLVK